MPKVNKEKASNAITNPPHPGDPTSDVSRESGQPLHKPPQAGAWRDADGEWHAHEDHADYVDGDGNVIPVVDDGDDDREKAAAVPENTAGEPYQWRDDPMPEGAQERLDWAQRGTDTEARVNAALRAEEARGHRRRGTVITGLEKLREEHRRNEAQNAQ